MLLNWEWKLLSPLTYPLTAMVIGAPQMILQPVALILPCSPLPSGTWRWKVIISKSWSLPISAPGKLCGSISPNTVFIRCWRAHVCSLHQLSFGRPLEKHGALRPQKPLRLIRDREVGGSGFFLSHTYSLHSSPEWFCIKLGSCVSHFDVSLIVWAKSQDSVHKPQFLKTEESWSGSNRGPSVYQPSTLLLLC